MGRISYNRQEQVEQVARELRQHAIPCDVIHIDTDWFAHDWACDLKFGPHKFPDPQAMMARLKAQGFRVCLWQWPNLVVGTDMFQEARERGFLAKRPNGRSYTYSGFEDDAGIIDYSNPDAVAWVQAKFTALFETGAAAIKADFGEGAPPTARYATQRGAAMHNLYPLLYNQAVWEATERCLGPGQAVIWARSAWAGSQRYPVHWSGDGVARYADMPCVLRAALSFGLSGFPFYSHDIGGFSGLPAPDLYVRWAQFGLFSSHARAHGVPPREPWAFGPEAEAIVKRYVELRYRLMPYIYSEAVASVAASLPMVRALLLEYDDDPVTYLLDDQYLFGSALLVAPILDESGARRVYLPHGDWWDYWRKERVAGGRFLAIAADLATLPLYVRAGSVLPYAPLMQHTGATPYDPLTLELYAPATSGGYTIYDEGAAPIAIAYQREGGVLTVTGDACPGIVELVLYGVAARQARCPGTELAIEQQNDGGLRVAFDGRQAWAATFAE
jgi:alpha-D-xyloside xylohydrolase